MTQQTGATVAAPARDPKWWTLVAVCLGVFMLLLDITIVNVALPDIQGELDASLSDLQWVIDAYALSLAALLLTAGSLADLFGRRRVFVIGLVIFTVGSVACGAAQDILFLRSPAPSRASAARRCSPPRWRCSAAAFRGKDRGTAFGVFGATTGVAVAIGPVLGGVLTSGLSWRWIFFVNMPDRPGRHRGLAARRSASRRTRTPGRPDWIGFVTFTLALGALVYGLIEAGKDGWGDGRVVASLRRRRRCCWSSSWSARCCRSTRCSTSALLRKPTFTGGLIAAFGVSASIFSLLTYLVIYVQNVLGYSAVGDRPAVPVPLGRVLRRRGRRRPAHRATCPCKWLIAPGLLVLGVGLLLMRGIERRLVAGPT